MNHLKIFFTTLMLAVMVLLIAVPVTAAPVSGKYDPLAAGCQGQTTPSCSQAVGQGTTDPIAGPNGIINNAATVIAFVAGIGAVFMVIIGGFFYVTAGGAAGGQRAGDTNNAKKAQARIVNALIGLVVIALSGTIIMFVTEKVIR